MPLGMSGACVPERAMISKSPDASDQMPMPLLRERIAENATWPAELNYYRLEAGRFGDS
jgi:hypothetical protein